MEEFTIGSLITDPVFQQGIFAHPVFHSVGGAGAGAGAGAGVGVGVGQARRCRRLLSVGWCRRGRPGRSGGENGSVRIGSVWSHV